MGYSDYTFEKIKNKFGVENQTQHNLLGVTNVVQPSDFLLKQLDIASSLRIKSEKARSEWIVAPILTELREQNDKFFTIYSGDNLNVNDDLRGECDFILAKDTNTYDINFPIIQIVEAKKHDIEDLGIPQCAAQLLGAKIFNQNNGIELKKIYGCATTGKLWQFLVLEENTIYVDDKQYYLGNLPELLGAFQYIIDYYKKELN